MNNRSIFNTNTPAYMSLSPPTAMNAGAGRTIADRRNVRLQELHAGPIHRTTSGITTSPKAYDPPRPSREGYEWVWFPAGYWAERETAETPRSKKPGSSPRPFRWRKRSAKDSSGGWKKHDSQQTSPMTQTESPLSAPLTALAPNPRPQPPLASPYLSEAMHVQSLQQPGFFTQQRPSSADSESSEVIGLTGNKPKAPLPTPWPSEESRVPSNQRRSYFHFGGASSEGTSSSTARTSSRLSTKPSLSPGTSEVARAGSTQRRTLHFTKPSRESFASIATSDASESTSRTFPSSPLRFSRETGARMLPNVQIQAHGTRKSGPSDIVPSGAIPRQSFVKRLMFEIKPVSLITYILTFLRPDLPMSTIVQSLVPIGSVL